MTPAIVEPTMGMRSNSATTRARSSIGNAEHQQPHVGADTGDHRSHEVAEHESANSVEDFVGQTCDSLTSATGNHRQPELLHPGQGDQKVDREGHDADRRHPYGEEGSAGTEYPTSGNLQLRLSLQIAGEVKFHHQLPGPTLAGGQVRLVAGVVRDQAVDLMGNGWRCGQDERDDDKHEPESHDNHREPARNHAGQPLQDRVQANGDEQGQAHNDQDVGNLSDGPEDDIATTTPNAPMRPTKNGAR